MAPTKAVIVNKDNDTPNSRVECLFNPSVYTISKTNSWTGAVVSRGDAEQLFFSGGESRTLTMDLMFDVYESGGDVRTHINKLWNLMFVDPSLKSKQTPEKGRPPLVIFEWGNGWSFIAAITSISVNYTLFRADGTPVRATANVTFKEAEPEKPKAGQNPTSRAEPGQSLRAVRPRDTLALIAYEEYRDSGQWREIARANDLEDPLALHPGQLLVIPRLD